MVVLRAMAPYALMVHGGLSRIRSMLNMMAGMAWKPLSSFTVSFSHIDAGIGALSIEMELRRTNRGAGVMPAPGVLPGNGQWHRGPSRER